MTLRNRPIGRTRSGRSHAYRSDSGRADVGTAGIAEVRLSRSRTRSRLGGSQAGGPRCRAFPGRARGRRSKTYELLGIHPGVDLARADGNARETGGRSGIGHGEGISHHHEGVAKTAYHPLVAVFTIFDAARKHGVNDQARAAYDASVACHRQTVLTAFQPVGRQSCGFERCWNKRQESRQSQVQSARRSLDLSDSRYVRWGHQLS